MEFITLDAETFREFVDKHQNKSFLQTPEIAKLREKNGWTVYYFGVTEKGKLKAASLVVAKPTFLGKSTFYAPGGPLMDYEDTALVEFFFKNLKNYARTHNGYILHIEPYYELLERDRDGEVIKEGFNHQKVLKNLQNFGFQPTQPDNPQYLFALDIKGKSEQEIFSSFKQNTRNLVSRTAKKGITVRELEKSELKTFKSITESTSERRHFSDKTLDYYETMYDLFHDRGEVKFIIAEIKVEELVIPLSAAMFITYGDEVIYLFSGSDAKYMKEYNAQYAIQWYMIKYAIKNHFKRYNFYGIQGLPDPKKPGYGIYTFKKGFGAKYGKVIELLGAYELPTNQFFHQLHRFLSKLKHH